MKGLSTLFYIVAFLFLSSCKDKSDTNCPADCTNCKLLFTWVSDSISYSTSSSNYNNTPPTYNQYGPNTYLYNDTFRFSVEDNTICDYSINVIQSTYSGNVISKVWQLKTWENDKINFGYSEYSTDGQITIYSDENKLFIKTSRFWGSMGVMHTDITNYYLRKL